MLNEIMTHDTRAWHSPPTFAAAINPHHTNKQQALLDQRTMWHTQMLAGATKARIDVVHAHFPAAIAAAADCVTPSFGITPETLAAEK